MSAQQAKATVSVEIITERKIIPVLQGWLYSSVDRIEVDVCVICAAVVFDPIGHDGWHRSSADDPGHAIRALDATPTTENRSAS